MIRSRLIGPALTLVAAFAAFAGCSKDEQEAAKFPTRDAPTPVARGELGPLEKMTLENGITAFIRRETTEPIVAVEVLYRAGLYHEPKGKPQTAHLLEHMLIFSATASYGPGESIQAVKDMSKLAPGAGRVSGEAVGDFVHYDYVVAAGELETALKIESERLTSVKFDDQTRAREAQRCMDEISQIEQQGGSLVKYAVMTLNQALNHGETSVSLNQGVNAVTDADMAGFMETHYRPDDMVIVLLGDLDVEAAKALVQKYFGGLESRPAPDPATNSLSDRKTSVTWDMSRDVLELVFPGPYENAKERIALSMFGAFFHRFLINNETAIALAKATYTSNLVYTVGDIPFFIHIEPNRNVTTEDARQPILELLDAVMTNINETQFEMMQGNVNNFMNSSMLERQIGVSMQSHYQILGQEALNMGIHHMVTEGMGVDEYMEVVDSITYEEMKQILKARFTPENLREIHIFAR